MSMRTILAGELGPAETNALLCGGVGPRPIALASTISAEGVRNLAPFSFYNAFGSNPPVIGFGPNRRARDGSVKHSYLNAVATRERAPRRRRGAWPSETKNAARAPL